MKPSFIVGVIANPLSFNILLPLVVSTDNIASMAGFTSILFMVCMSTGEPMKELDHVAPWVRLDKCEC